MSDGTPESLAREILEGTYTLSTLEECKPDLPVDRNPQVVRFTQFVLFSNPKIDPRFPKEPEYLILQQYQLFSGGPDPDKVIIDNLVKPMTSVLSLDLLKGPISGVGVLEPETLPDPNDAQINIDRLRAIALDRRIPGYHPNMADAELRSLYKGWATELLREQLLDMVEPLEKAGFDFYEELTVDIKKKNINDVLSNILKKILLPPSQYQPFKNPHPHFALCAIFEQVWEPKGYTRGELINTISLAPGEQLTLEIHSWDKSTIKSEEELATESEFRVSENLTERDVRTVVRNAGTKFHVTANIPIKGGGSVTPSGEVNTSLQNTLNQTRERTVQASNTLKTTRKLRIEVSREVGREQKQTRVVANTNRCHTLNCQYFEIMSNYLVTTRLESVRLCLLLPFTRAKVTPAWVLCYKDVLTQALLHKAFLPGFEAAKTLETHEAFLKLKKEEAKAKGEVASPLEDELKRHVDAITGADKDLRNALNKVKDAAKGPKVCVPYVGCYRQPLWGLALAVYVATKCNLTCLRRMLFMALLYTNKPAINALKKLLDDKEKNVKSSEALRSFFAVVTPRDFQYNVVNATIAKALDAAGIPEKLVDALIAWNILAHVDFAADDAGLYNAVKAAAVRLDEIWELPPTAEPGVVKEGFSTMEIAEAQTVFEQLKCHIEDNWAHYMQAYWLREHADQRFLRLQNYGMVAAILDNDLLGFLGHKAAYPINDLEAVKRWIDFNEMKKTISIPLGEPQLVTMPTHGTILEAMVGECDACEDFIQQSRLIDLRVQEAKAKEEESEANRYQKRVESGDYSDPKTLTAGKVVISIDGDKTQPPA